MREIKFRAWYTPFKNKKFGTGYKYGNSVISFHDMAPDKYELEQYTGLKDKNGVEIYENDIIEISDTSYGDSQNHYGVVKYSEYAELVVGNILLSRIYNAIEVIGNIHENADLLEEQS